MMANVTAEETQAYIHKYYVTRGELAELAGISEQRVVELVQAKCIPPHAYEARGDIQYISSFGKYSLPSSPKFFYHPRLVDWIERAEALAETHSLSEVADLVKSAFADDINKALDGRPLLWPDGIGHVWDYLMDGTWSLCLKQFNVPDLVQKEIARATISKIEREAMDGSIASDKRQELENAVEQYDHVALPFSPHEQPESSRCLEVGAVIKKFGLSERDEVIAAQ